MPVPSVKCLFTSLVLVSLWVVCPRCFEDVLYIFVTPSFPDDFTAYIVNIFDHLLISLVTFLGFEFKNISNYSISQV